MQGLMRRSFKTASRKLRKNTQKGHAQAKLLVDRARSILFGQEDGSKGPNQVCTAEDSVTDAQPVIEIISETAEALSSLAQTSENSQQAADRRDQEFNILGTAHERLRSMIGDGDTATTLRGEESSARASDFDKSTRKLKRADEVATTPQGQRTNTFTLLNMDDHQDPPMTLDGRCFANAASIRRRLTMVYEKKHDGPLAFRLWYELQGSPCGVSKRFWKLGEQNGRIPDGLCRLYFLNVAPRTGQSGVRLYTVVTVSQDEHEDPFPVDIPVSGNISCCQQSCRNVQTHLRGLWASQPWEILSMQPLGEQANNTHLVDGPFNDDTLSPYENTLYVWVIPKISPGPNVT